MSLISLVSAVCCRVKLRYKVPALLYWLSCLIRERTSQHSFDRHACITVNMMVNFRNFAILIPQ